MQLKKPMVRPIRNQLASATAATLFIAGHTIQVEPKSASTLRVRVRYAPAGNKSCR